MLVLTRKVDGGIMIGDPQRPEECIEVQVIEVRGDGSNAQVRLGVKAPKDVPVHRTEVYESIQREKQAAGTDGVDVPSFRAA